MYKGASQSLQRRHAVDRPHPSRGYIDGGPDETDTLTSPSSLSVEALRDEQKQLRREILQAEQEITVAKVTKDAATVRHMGQRKVVLCGRLSEVNKALNAKDGPSELARFMTAAREIVGDEVMNAIVARSKELRGPA